MQQSNERTLAAAAKAISHPARIAILRTLGGRGVCVCGEIVEVLPLAQSTVSEHLRVLKSAGLVQGKVDGPRSCYCLDQGAIRRLRAELIEFMDDLEQPDACCP